jgi:hypothetical protein
VHKRLARGASVAVVEIAGELQQLHVKGRTPSEFIGLHAVLRVWAEVSGNLFI